MDWVGILKGVCLAVSLMSSPMILAAVIHGSREINGGVVVSWGVATAGFIVSMGWVN